MSINSKTGRNKCFLIGCLLAGLSLSVFSQGEKKFIRQGNSQYKDNKFSGAEISYRKAIDQNKQAPDAGFNLGDALYKQNKFDEAGKQFVESFSTMADRKKKSASMFNLGNSLLNGKKIQESIDAYKNSLKLDPGNKEAKYNLAYAQDLLKLQQQQQQQQQDQNKKDNEKNKDNKKEDQKKDQNQDNKKDQKDQQQQQQQQGISKEDAQRLLNAIANDEKNVQEKVKLAKAAKEKVRSRINW
jgi:Ca-activated chloride channel family protein